MGTYTHPVGVAVRPRPKRGKGRYKSDHSLHDLFVFYKKVTPESNQVSSYSVFNAIIKDFHKQIVKDIIKEGRGFQIPFANGEVRICKYLKNRGSSLPIDFKRSYELGFRVAHLNEERKGAIYKWKWLKPRRLRGRKPWLYYYTFIPCRTIKRQLAEELKANTQLDYFEFIKVRTY